MSKNPHRAAGALNECRGGPAGRRSLPEQRVERVTVVWVDMYDKQGVREACLQPCQCHGGLYPSLVFLLISFPLLIVNIMVMRIMVEGHLIIIVFIIIKVVLINRDLLLLSLYYGYCKYQYQVIIIIIIIIFKLCRCDYVFVYVMLFV